ncbi:MAG: insulinase family protein [Planctomycetia bacterium]|nr:insulinase family protein [Planctomycetia bacterium]
MTALGMLPSAARAREVEPEPVLRATFDNGLRVIIVRNPLAPVVTTMVNYLAGSDESPVGFPGTAHAMEHMMFRGSPGLSAEQLASISSALGGDSNADTQESVTRYHFTLPSDDLDLALHIEALRMRGITCTDEQWDKERGAIEQEVADDLSNPTYIFYTKLREVMYRGTPYAHDALGTRPSFDKTTAKMLQKFHAEWYVPNNAILLIVGDVQPTAALDKVRGLFGGIPRRELASRPEVKLQPVQPTHFNLPTDESSGQAVVCFRLPGTDSPDYAALLVLGDVLSSQRGRLHGLVVSGKALDASFSYDTLRQSGLGYADASFPKGADGMKLLAEIKQVLAKDLAEGFSAELVAAAKRHRVVDAAFSRNSIAGLADAWSVAVAVEGRHSPDDDLKAIERVTVADVNRVARKYLDLKQTVTAILTPQDSDKPSSGSGQGHKESFTSKESKAVELPDWAQATLRHLDVPGSGIHPTVTTLPNGLKLIVQPESLTATISVYGRVRHSTALQTPAGQEGVDLVLDELFSYGTRSLGRDAFEKALDDIGVSVTAGADFSLKAMAGDFPRGVQLLAENLLQPALPEESFKIVRKQVAENAAGELESPAYLTERAMLSALLPAKDLLLRQTTPKTVNALTLDDVRHYHHQVFRPDLTTIVVIGNITPSEAERVIGKAFGQWTAEGPKPITDLPGVPDNKASAKVVPDSSRVQCKVLLAETLGLTRSNPDFYALQLGNHVLGGGFYATRLYRDLRKDNGLVYSIESSFDIGKTRSTLALEFGCDPPNVAKAHAVIERNLKDMQAKAVSADELGQAKRQLLRELVLSEASLKEIADSLLTLATRDLPLDERTRAARIYRDLTAEQVQAAYAKWVRPDALVQIVEGPEPK